MVAGLDSWENLLQGLLEPFSLLASLLFNWINVVLWLVIWSFLPRSIDFLILVLVLCTFLVGVLEELLLVNHLGLSPRLHPGEIELLLRLWILEGDLELQVVDSAIQGVWVPRWWWLPRLPGVDDTQCLSVIFTVQVLPVVLHLLDPGLVEGWEELAHLDLGNNHPLWRSPSLGRQLLLHEK